MADVAYLAGMIVSGNTLNAAAFLAWRQDEPAECEDDIRNRGFSSPVLDAVVATAPLPTIELRDRICALVPLGQQRWSPDQTPKSTRSA